MADLQTQGLGQVRERIGASSSSEVIAQSIEAAREIADLGAFITVADRAEAGVGPLAGVPLAVKDNLDTRDFRTTGGTPALAQSRPGRDHHAVERLRAAGAAVIGKTNLHELALGITSNNAAFGPVRNPHDPSRSAGGSPRIRSDKENVGVIGGYATCGRAATRTVRSASSARAIRPNSVNVGTVPPASNRATAD